MIYAIIMVLGTLTMTGCNKWVAEESWGYAVWADDAQRVAATRVHFERQNTFMSSITRNFSFEIHTADIDGLNNTAARGSIIPGSPEGMYYMSVSDYVVATSRVPVEGGTAFKLYQFLSSGEVRMLKEVPPSESRKSCSGFQVMNNSASPARAIPSPDGSVVALVYLTLSCDGVAVEVNFLNAESGQSIDGPNQYELPVNSLLIWDGNPDKSYVAYMNVAWSQDERLMVGFDEVINDVTSDTVKGWYLGPNEAPVEFSDMEKSCFSPATTSASTNVAGQRVRASSENGLSIEAGSSSGPTFGCN